MHREAYTRVVIFYWAINLILLFGHYLGKKPSLIDSIMQPGLVFPTPTVFSIDVECVATGTDHNAREVGQLSLVVSRAGNFYQFQVEAHHSLLTLQDQFERVVLNIYVKPKSPVVSYLTPLTGYACFRNTPFDHTLPRCSPLLTSLFPFLSG